MVCQEFLFFVHNKGLGLGGIISGGEEMEEGGKEEDHEQNDLDKEEEQRRVRMRKDNRFQIQSRRRGIRMGR